MGAQAGLLPYGDPDLFVPFLEDRSTGLWLLPPPSNHFALNTEIQQPPVKPIFSHNGRLNAYTDVFNENGRFAKFSETINGNIVDCMCIYPNSEIYVKLDDDRDTIDSSLFIFGKLTVSISPTISTL